MGMRGQGYRTQRRRSWWCLGLGALLLAGAAPAAEPERQALVIGNAAYTGEPVLVNTRNDSVDMARKLIGLGFRVTAHQDLGRRDLARALTDFVRQVRGSDGVALFYYSGHGLQVGGRNYLVPVDAQLHDALDVPNETIPVDTLLAGLGERGDSAVNLIVLDACRNNPYLRSDRKAIGDKGLARVEAPGGTLILYATRPGETASDNPAGRNGLFTQHLLTALDQPGVPVEETFKQVARGVQRDSKKAQTPWQEGLILGQFYFRPVVGGGGPVPPVQAGSDTPAATWTEPKTGMVFVPVPAGRFQMGCGGAWAGECQEIEKPARQVQVKGYWLATTEVTQAQWQAVMGSNPSNFKDCADCPVEQVSWNDAQAFIAKLDPGGQQGLRLPTEAEWEYACRSGGKEETYCGGKDLDRLAWYDKNSGDKTHPVGGKTANGLGLYDMSGNVSEWTCSALTLYDGAEQRCISNNDAKLAKLGLVLRGGSWNGSSEARAADRLNGDPEERWVNIGLRLARTLSP
jgi:formylglycine-generating enzyme required for sulfatase activity